jgi:hypothetical protein
VRARQLDLKPGLGHHADVDAAIVVALDQHRVRVGLPADAAQHHATEVAQRPARLGLHDAKDVGVNLEHHARGVTRCLLVDGFAFQLHPTNPIRAAAGNDLHGAVLAAAHELPAVLAQQRKLPTVVVLTQPERLEQLKDPLTVLLAVGGLTQQRVDLAVRRDRVCAPITRSRSVGRQRLSALKEVLHVV